jgi:hypothetical protein
VRKVEKNKYNNKAKIDVKKKTFTKWIFLTPVVHKIKNSLLCKCLIINIVKAIKNENGINFGAIPIRFKIEYLK